MLGNQANLTYVKSLLNISKEYALEILYQKDIKSYIRNKTKGYDIFISTRIDYDDRIFYDAVNDVKRAINESKPNAFFTVTI